MNHSDLVAFARTELEPVQDTRGALAYRCSAHLTDGVYLPCVLLASADAQLELALRRFKATWAEENRIPFVRRPQVQGFGYREIVQTFVASGNHLNHYDIARVEKSPFAIPLARLVEIDGETSMSWTQFAAVMKDGHEFYFGTTFLTEFFQMPEGYTGEDIARILPHRGNQGNVYRERPYFTCFVEGLARRSTAQRVDEGDAGHCMFLCIRQLQCVRPAHLILSVMRLGNVVA